MQNDYLKIRTVIESKHFKKRKKDLNIPIKYLDEILTGAIWVIAGTPYYGDRTGNTDIYAIKLDVPEYMGININYITFYYIIHLMIMKLL